MSVTSSRALSDAGRTMLTDAVARSSNLRQVFLRLGLSVGGGAWVAMKDHIVRLQLDTSHWERVPQGRHGARVPLPEWTDIEVRAAFDGARSIAEVMRRLGLDPLRKRGRRAVEQRLDRLGLDRDQLAGQRWNSGRTVPVAQRRGRPLAEILVADSDYGSTPTLKRRLIAAGLLDAVCARCSISMWLGEAAPLHLDHVNGDRRDNRIENLRLLCPNCHALTDTYCGRNIGRR